MAKDRRVFVCRECGAEFVSWAGQCSGCDGWASIEEASVAKVRSGASTDPNVQALGDFDVAGAIPIPTGIDEVDRVLGGGLVPSSVSLLGGEPGIGKSTLSLQLAMSVAKAGSSVIVVTGEEAPTQVAARAGRIGEIPDELSVVDTTDVDAIVAAIVSERPQLAIIDSIQTLQSSDADSAPGSVTQVRAAAHRMVEVAKRTGTSIVLIGHVTKDGNLAGPRLLEHVVDTVLSFTGDRHHDLRFLRAVKHRFGSTTEVGVFEMVTGGLKAVADPSKRFLADRRPGQPGSIVVPTLDQHRPVLVELQALTSAHGERPVSLTGNGVSNIRLKLVAAVVQERGGVGLWGNEVFASAAGGAAVDEPGGDLALALAITTAATGVGIAADVVACGELGLSGEVRSVAQLDRRMQEAHRMGFRRAVVPTSSPNGPTGLELIRVDTIVDALGLLPALAAKSVHRAA